ncbi:MAG: DUF2652 domain-containing protein [Myxococcales bacterium]|nr:DUF2652 domain-containing protein [Myxococcales bacterium]
MNPLRGYLLIADLSGYTAYLTSTELTHATPIIISLLESMVERLAHPLHLWRLEGDAVLAYTTDENFPSGETFLTICEDVYNAFATRRQDIHANTTCPCRACAQVPELDLKLIVHHGAFEEVKIGPMRDISGADVIQVHRMAKTRVREATGIRSYSLFSDAAFVAMGSPSGLVPYSEPLAHFGDVQMHAYDLATAWRALRQARERVFFGEDEGIWTIRAQLPVPPRVAWEILVSARSKQRWMELISVTVHSESGRPGPGARYHCVHAMGDFTCWVVDWEPFAYFSNEFVVYFDPALRHRETYELVETEGGCELRYTCGPVVDPERPEARSAEWDAKLLEFYQPGYRHWLKGLTDNLEKDPGFYA